MVTLVFKYNLSLFKLSIPSISGKCEQVIHSVVDGRPSHFNVLGTGTFQVVIVYIFLFFLYPLLRSNHANSSPTLAHELLPRLWLWLRLGLVGDTKNLRRRIGGVQQVRLLHLLDLHRLLLL
jgi:hypothetical protein